MDVNSQIQNLLGTVPNAGPTQGTANSGRSETLPASVSAIATNGSLLIQNVSKLTDTLDAVLTDLGAP
jgi:hypothetical protein